MNTALKLCALLAALIACASSPRHARTTTPAAPRERGCAVEVSADAPTRAVQGLGDVTALCTDETANDRAGCTRVLSDQACALGADVLWGLQSQRDDDGLRMRAYAGRYR